MTMDIGALRGIVGDQAAQQLAPMLEAMDSLGATPSEISDAIGTGIREQAGASASLGHLRTQLAGLADSVAGADYSSRLYASQLGREPLLQALRAVEQAGGDRTAIGTLAQDVLHTELFDDPALAKRFGEVAAQHADVANITPLFVMGPLHDAGMVRGSAAWNAITPAFGDVAADVTRLGKVAASGDAVSIDTARSAMDASLGKLQAAIREHLQPSPAAAGTSGAAAAA